MSPAKNATPKKSVSKSKKTPNEKRKPEARDVWEAIFGTYGINFEFSREVIREGNYLPEFNAENLEQAEEFQKEKGGICAHPSDSPLQVFAIIAPENGELVCTDCIPAAPFGAECELTITSVKLREHGEGLRDVSDLPQYVITAESYNGIEVSFLAPTFSRDKEILHPHSRFLFRMSAIAYFAEKIPPSFDVTDGPRIEEAKERAKKAGKNPDEIKSVTFKWGNMFPQRHDANDESEFVSKVSEIEEFTFQGRSFLRLRLHAGTPKDRTEIPFNVYVCKNYIHNNIKFAIGDTVHGIAQLQGIPIKKLPPLDPKNRLQRN